MHVTAQLISLISLIYCVKIVCILLFWNSVIPYQSVFLRNVNYFVEFYHLVILFWWTEHLVIFDVLFYLNELEIMWQLSMNYHFSSESNVQLET